MCLAFPMKVDRVDGAMAEVSVGDIQATVSVQLLDKVKKGDYVLVHAGIAIEKVGKDRADEILTFMAELSQAIDSERKPSS